MIAESPSHTVDRCVACGSSRLDPVLDLGAQPLANNFVAGARAAVEQPRFPLGVQACAACALVQLTHIVDPTAMFSSYLYVPSASTTWVAHCEDMAEDVCARASLEPGDFVVEIGSNDGTLLRPFIRRGMRVLGVDPAANIAEMANAAGVPTLNRFFDEETAREIVARHGTARAVVSTNVLAHVPDPTSVLRGVRAVLARDGIYVNESPSLRDLVAHNEFDTIYHEHVSYFSLHALVNLFARAELRIVDAEPQAIHGGTLRVEAVHAERTRPTGPAMNALLVDERAARVLDAASLRAFAHRTGSVRDRLKALLARLKDQGARVAAYGATAKGNTLLGYCGLTDADVAYIVDRNPLKQGLLAPGSGIPIVSPDRLAADPPDVLLLLAWNLADEIRQQLAWFSEAGGQFLIPVPDPRLV